MYYHHCSTLLGGVMPAASAYAQTLPQHSLVEGPQQGATPRPIGEGEAVPTVSRSRIAAGLAQSQAQLSALNRRLPALQDRVARSLVTAPLDGIVNRVMATTVGGAVGAGDPPVEIVPAGESLMLEARLLPKAIGFVRIGQPARIRITAYPSNACGSLEGTVVAISLDATIDPDSGEGFYTVQVRSRGSLEDLHGVASLRVAGGMPADISLLWVTRGRFSLT